MSEMLANHYYQLKNYVLAECIYERLIPSELSDNKVLKRLIICYTQTNKIDKASELFLQLIQSDFNIILRTDRDEEFCPCDELISKIENGEIKYESRFHTLTVLGILWMYCNYKMSLSFFNKALEEIPDNEQVKKILKVIENYSDQINNKTN